ncbi:MAG: hypothetical protein ABSH05_02220 [Bryobacteraceae bacterium]|jgi:hypothetical protein
MIGFAAIEKQFDETLGFLQRDLSRIRVLEPGVNYAAAALIACACDVIAKRRGVAEADVFKNLLPPGRPYEVIGKTLYEALRNGLVHGYDTKEIVFDGTSIGLIVAWKETPHLSVVPHCGKQCLVLNVQALSDRLSAEIDKFRQELKQCPGARDKFFTSCQPDQREEVYGTEASEWRSLMTTDPRTSD